MKFSSISHMLAIATVIPIVASAQTPQGIYIGSFAGQTDNGGFALFIANERAEVVGFNTPQDEGVYARSMAVGTNGQFSGFTVQGTMFSATVDDSGVSGSFHPPLEAPGNFSGNRKEDEGPLSANAGFYEGTYHGAVSGNCYAILASDGTIFFYVIDDPLSPAADGDGGGTGSVLATSYQLSATMIPSGIAVSGTLNPDTNEIIGTYSLFSFSGTFTMTRTKALPGTTGGFAASLAAAGLSGTDALPDAIPFNDGVENLLKYAFNMNLGGPDSSTMTAGGTAGLPDASLDLSGETPVWRVELVRRKGGELTYTPLTSTTLAAEDFSTMTGASTVIDIDAVWERVVIEEPCDPETIPSYFSRVRVDIDDATGGGGNDGSGQPLRLAGPHQIITLGVPIEKTLTYGVHSDSPVVSATAQWISGGTIIKTEDLPTLSNRTTSCPLFVQPGIYLVCLQTSLNMAEAIGPSTLSVTVVNAAGETATVQKGEFFVNAGPFNGVWAGPVTQFSTCGDDDTGGETITIIQGSNNSVGIYGLIGGNNWVSGTIDNGVISGNSIYQTWTESGIPVTVTEWEATLVGPDVLEGSATFTSHEDSLTDCSGSFSFSFTRQ